MSSYFDTPEYAELKTERDALFHAPGRLDYNRPEISLLDQRIADGRWHHENPGLTGSWRISYKGESIIDSAPRFETEAAAAAFIAEQSDMIRHYAKPLYRPSRQTLDARVARYPVAA